jgi:dTDP-4-dehydrorhamnose 3,5-epimerase
MEKIETGIDGLFIVTPQFFSDNRGLFFEVFNAEKYKELGIHHSFVQDNLSLSSKNVLRGLHFQVPPFAQAKLVRVDCGAALDVAVDLRKESPTFGQYRSAVLSAENRHQLWVPEGFAHGFLALEENTIFSYKCSNVYHKESERAILWNDPTLNINWGIANPVVSDKDAMAMLFHEFQSPF